MATDLTGETFGSFKLVGSLGRGGMATVYKGYQESIDRYVAVKVLPHEFLHDPNFATRFLAEAKTLAKLTHSAILPIYDFGYSNDIPYIVMPIMSNGTLSDKIKKGALSIEEAIRIFAPIADALDFAHKLGVLHRDVKPSNILFDQNDNPFLADFGIAKAMESASSLTGTGIVGTPDYMSPEQARGETLDGRSDIYSLGVMVYQTLTGNPLFRATTPIGVMLKHATETPPPLRELRPDLSSAIEKAIEKCLAKYPQDRWQTANEFMRALKQAQASATTYPNASTATMIEPKVVTPPPAMWKEPQRTVTPPPQAKSSVPSSPAKKSGGPSWLVGGGIGMFVGIGLVTLFICGSCFALYLLGSAIEGKGTPTPPIPTATTEPPLLTLFSDEFSDPNSGVWSLLNSDNARITYANGEYVMKLNKTKWFVWSNPTMSKNNYKNVIAEAIVTKTNLAGDASFGVMCNYVDKENYYYAGVDTQGFYAIVKYKAQKDNFLTGGGKWAKSSLITPKASSYDISFECDRGQLALYIDNDLIDKVEDSDYTSGNVGIFAWSNDNPAAEIHFDKFIISQIP